MESVRFFPKWAPGEISQVVGLLKMVNAVFGLNPHASRWIEIGSFEGESATLFLGFPQITKLQCVEQSQSHAEMLKKKLRREIEAGRCDVYATFSSTFAAVVEEKSVDVVYIDGNHEYEAVSQDIAAFSPKLRAGGILCGHDYVKTWPGVIRAVDEFVQSGDGRLTMRTFEDGSWLLHGGW